MHNFHDRWFKDVGTIDTLITWQCCGWARTPEMHKSSVLQTKSFYCIGSVSWRLTEHDTRDWLGSEERTTRQISGRDGLEKGRLVDPQTLVVDVNLMPFWGRRSMISTLQHMMCQYKYIGTQPSRIYKWTMVAEVGIWVTLLTTSKLPRSLGLYRPLFSESPYPKNHCKSMSRLLLEWATLTMTDPCTIRGSRYLANHKLVGNLHPNLPHHPWHIYSA